MQKLLLRPKEGFQVLDIKRSVGYALLASGELPSIRIGRSIFIPVKAIEEFIERKLAANREDV